MIGWLNGLVGWLVVRLFGWLVEGFRTFWVSLSRWLWSGGQEHKGRREDNGWKGNGMNRLNWIAITGPGLNFFGLESIGMDWNGMEWNGKGRAETTGLKTPEKSSQPNETSAAADITFKAYPRLSSSLLFSPLLSSPFLSSPLPSFHFLPHPTSPYPTAPLHSSYFLSTGITPFKLVMKHMKYLSRNLPPRE